MGQIEKAHKGLQLIVFPTLSSGILFLLLLFSNVFFPKTLHMYEQICLYISCHFKIQSSI